MHVGTKNYRKVAARCNFLVRTIEKDPTLPEAELLKTLKSDCTKLWTASENKKLVEAYEIWGELDYSAISLHVGTKSTEQVQGKLKVLQ